MLSPLVVASHRVLGIRIRTMRALLGAMVGCLGGRASSRLAVPNFLKLPGLYAGAAHPDRWLRVSGDPDVPVHRRSGVPQWWWAGSVGRPTSIRWRSARARRVLVSEQDRGEARDRAVPGWGGVAPDGTRHAVLARPLRRALEGCRGRLREARQVLSTRPDLLPPAFIDERRKLRDQGTPVLRRAVAGLHGHSDRCYGRVAAGECGWLAGQSGADAASAVRQLPAGHERRLED